MRRSASKELEEFLSLLDDIEEALPKIRNEARWLHEVAWGQGRTGEPRTSGGDVSNPTASIATSRSQARGVFRKAMRQTRYAALRLTLGAYELMAEYLDPSDSRDLRSRPRPTGLIQHPREIEESRAKKLERERRGEGWGSG